MLEIEEVDAVVYRPGRSSLPAQLVRVYFVFTWEMVLPEIGPGSRVLLGREARIWDEGVGGWVPVLVADDGMEVVVMTTQERLRFVSWGPHRDPCEALTDQQTDRYRKYARQNFDGGRDVSV